MDRPKDRSTLSVGYQWAARISTIGLEFALPPLLGVFLDRWWHTAPLVTILGSIAGFAVGMMHVLRLARDSPGPR